MGRMPVEVFRGSVQIRGPLFLGNAGIYVQAGRPVDGATGTYAGEAGPGSIIIRTTGKLYMNTGTITVPVWSALAIAASSVSPSASVSSSASVSPSSSVSQSKSPSASVSPSASPSQSPSASSSPSASKSPSSSASPSPSPT